MEFAMVASHRVARVRKLKARGSKLKAQNRDGIRDAGEPHRSSNRRAD
jgi:hypothetical protein